jgi:hypothetical protein
VARVQREERIGHRPGRYGERRTQIEPQMLSLYDGYYKSLNTRQ